MKPHGPITLQEVYQARDRIKDAAIRTPLVRLNMDDLNREIYLKLESL